MSQKVIHSRGRSPWDGQLHFSIYIGATTGLLETLPPFLNLFSGGWDKTLKAMSEAFGENWEAEFTNITGEEPPGRHFYRNIYEEEEQKVR